MTNIMTKTEIEKFAVEPLEKSGYHYTYTPNIALDVSHVSLPLGETEEGVIH